VFIQAAKLESSDKRKTLLKEQIAGFLKRAEEIVEQLSVLDDIDRQFQAHVNVNLNVVDEDDRVQVASGFMSEGIEFDQIGDYKAARVKYQQAAEIFLEFAKEGDVQKRRVQEQTRVILERLEWIKKIEKRKISASGVDRKSKDFEEENMKVESVQEQHSDSGKLREEELDVLRETSFIGGKRFYPWMDIDKQERFTLDRGRFIDPDGRLALSPKQQTAFAAWKRPEDFLSNIEPKAIVLISPYSIKQTLITDCSFVSAISVASNYERMFKKKLLTNSLYPQDKNGNPKYNPWGKYTVKLHINGVDRKVTIDDALPVDSNNNLLCSYSKTPGELWVSLFEKAFLKVMGGYNFPGSNGGTDLHYLTGWIPERVSLKDDSKDGDGLDRYWERIFSGHNYGDCLVTCGTSALSNELADKLGLVPSHAYAILRVENVGKLRLMQLKNPWAHRSWNGKYSAQDLESWTPQLQQHLQFDPLKAQKRDDGIFWIDWESFIKYWDCIYLNWNPNLFKQRTSVHAVWPVDVGPVNDYVDMGANPQYRLKVPKKGTTVWVLLTKHLTEIKSLEKDDWITLHVYSNSGGKRVYYPHDPFMKGVYMNSPFYLQRWETEKENASYTLVVSQYKKSKDLYFTVDVYCTGEFKMADLIRPKYTKTITLQYTQKNSGGSANSSEYWFNPQYRVTIPGGTSLVNFQMKGPEFVQVNLMLFESNGEKVESFSTQRKADSGSYRNAFCYFEIEKPTPGEYTLIPSTWYPGETPTCLITVLSHGNPVKITPF
jgi:calpain-7